MIHILQGADEYFSKSCMLEVTVFNYDWLAIVLSEIQASLP